MAPQKTRARLDGADPINKGLLGFWPLDDGAGTIMRDISPYRGHGTSYVAGSGALGPLGVALGRGVKHPQFTSNTISSRVVMNHASGALSSAQVPLTIMAMVKPASVSGFKAIVGQYAATSASRLVKMLRIDSGTLTYYTTTSGGGFQSVSGPSISADAWHMVGVSVDPSRNISIYVDRTVVTGTLAAVSASPDTSVAVMIGDTTNANGEGFSGEIYGVRILARALSPTEWLRLYRDPWAGTARVRRPFVALVAGDVSVTLTGIGSTASAGTLAATLSEAISGEAITSAAGTLASDISSALTGGEATASPGSVSMTGTMALTGSAGTSAAGTITSALAAALAGSAGTTAAGTTAAGIAMAITGEALTVSAGSLAYTIGFTLSGVASTSASGSLTSSGGDTTRDVTLTGISMTASPGNVRVTGGTRWRPQAAQAVVPPSMVTPVAGNTLQPPPRLTGDAQADIRAQQQWLQTLYDRLVKEGNILGRVPDHERRLSSLENPDDTTS